MTVLYAVANGSGAIYRADEAEHYDWFKDEPAAQQFAQNTFDPLTEGTIFRLDFGPLDAELLCRLMARTYESRVRISVVRAPPFPRAPSTTGSA